MTILTNCVSFQSVIQITFQEINYEKDWPKFEMCGQKDFIQTSHKLRQKFCHLQELIQHEAMEQIYSHKETKEVQKLQRK